MQFKIAAALALAASASALQIVYPVQGSELDLTKQNTISWISVSTDPSSFDIYVVNENVYPTVNQKVATNVQTSKGSYVIDNIDVAPDKGYQINLESTDSQHPGILAQSGQFVIVSAGSPTSSASLTTSTSTGVTSTSTSTGTSTSTSASASFSSSSSASASAASSGSSSSSASSTANASGANASSTSTIHTGAASTLSVSTGATSLLLGLFALLM
ncbi:hypothetical protein VTN77DRAFT_6381 [Rasamsonia byssochlamydoides]|uniref:uncharacterized protein n=1 Tax=Rasamsonia byssochlamydoides TaxID=89139 RepID=UPI0037431E53